MKLCRYDDDKLGVVVGDKVHDVTAAQTEIRNSTSYTAKVDPVVAALPKWRDKLEQMAKAAPGKALSEVKLLSPVAKPPKILAAPTNYGKHIEEMQKFRDTIPGLARFSPDIEKAGIFLKSNTSLVGPSEGIPMRFPDRRNDHEAELVIIIGKQGSDIPKDKAWDYIAGYSLGLDMTARGQEDRSFRKSIDGYTVLGPWMITADELPKPGDVPFHLTVNGEKKQESNTSFLIFDIPKLIEFASKFYTLYPGDLYYTGTPEGVGPVKPGDTVVMKSLPQLGELSIKGEGAPDMIDVLRVGHATFTTPDLERQVDYYSNVLGLIVTERDKDRAYLATRTGLEAIALEKGDRAELTRLAFQVAPDADFGAYAKELSGHGIKSEQRNGISPGAARALVFTDIKGTVVELYSEYAFAKDDGKQATITPLKLGHVAHRVADVQKVVKFYTEVMGFRVSDWRDDTFAFLRCGVDHHSVNFVVDPKPQLHHIAFEVKDWPEIHRACDFLGKNKIELVWGPGRHIIGHNVAAYHRNADHVRVELFCEMDQIKDEALGYFDPRPWHQDRPQAPKTWPKDTLRNYWGFGSQGTFPGYP